MCRFGARFIILSLTIKNVNCFTIQIACFWTIFSLDGSARIALSGSCPFDEYIFVEQNRNRAKELDILRLEYHERNIKIYSEDCNELLRKLCKSSKIEYTRILIFLDPYSTEVEWNTIIELSKTKVIDLWYLFPLSTVNRMMPINGNFPDWAKIKLSRLFGDDSWKCLYSKPQQTSLFDTDDNIERQTDIGKMIGYIYKRLSTVFSKVSQDPAILRNSKNSPLFALFFAMTNPSESAQRLAFNIARDILNKK